MYCRTCEYDLRGQEEHRCPECGRAFDPNDRSTFLKTRPRWSRRTAWLITLVLTALLVSWWSWEATRPRLRGSREIGKFGISRDNLLQVLHHWQAQSLRSSESDALAVDGVRPALRPRSSWWSDHPAIIRRSTLGDWSRQCRMYVYPLPAYFVLLFLVWRNRSRRATWVAGVGFAIGVITVVFAVAPEPFQNLVAWKTMRYVDDYAYRDDLDWRTPSGACAPRGQVVAISKLPLAIDGQRIVGYENTDVAAIEEAVLRAQMTACGDTKGMALLDSVMRE